MAEYGVHQNRNFTTPSPYSHAPSANRDAAFSDIFGAAPHSGRSQTMTSQSQHYASADFHRPPPNQQQPQGVRNLPYQPQRNHSGLGRAYEGSGLNDGYGPQQPQNGYPPPDRRGPNASYQSAHGQPPGGSPDGRNYPLPPRVDSKGPYGSPAMNFHKPAPGPARYYTPGPALNVDPYRSRSLVGLDSSPYARDNSAAPMYQQGMGNSARAPPTMSNARVTAQGRAVPERHEERTMSLASYSTEKDRSQIMSGRILPSRRRESENSSLQDDSSPRESYRSQTYPLQKKRSPSQNSGRTSMTSTVVAPSDRSDSMVNRPSLTKSTSNATSTGTVVTAQRRAPLVYPALLSRVADKFFEGIGPGDRTKNDLTYKNAFLGSEAVDLITYIIKTTDRNLALLLGRALDAQRFFHDVTYDHRLRDSPQEVYQFQETLADTPSQVNGIFTLLTECYSATCTPDQLCYSIGCPRRLEQQARLNLKPQPGLRRQDSRSSLHEDQPEEQKLWINTVSKEVAASVSETEKKRQEVICEIMYTERDFVKDLEYLRDFWMKPLRGMVSNTPSPIPEYRRDKFIRTVFSNVMDVHSVNFRFAESLTRRQQQNPVVRNVGDIFLEWVPRFDPFIRYGSRQLYGKNEFEQEKSTNPAFSRFVDETERLKESRKLELNGYLTKPTTRLARYPLLLENVVKYTSDDNPDKTDIPKAIIMIREFLAKVNEESGKAENHMNLLKLNSQLDWSKEEYQDLKLTDDARQLLWKSALKKSPTENADIQVFVFDHCVLLVRTRMVNKREVFKVYRRPIPMSLLVITQMEEVIPRLGISKRPSSSLITSRTNLVNQRTTNSSQIFPVTFRHLGKFGGAETTLWSASQVQRRKLMEKIEAQQTSLKAKANVYAKRNLCENYFNPGNRVNCLVPIDGGRKLVIGTDNGIYVSEVKPREPASTPRKVIEISQITQIDVLEEYRMLLVLANKVVSSYTLDALDPNESLAALSKRPKRLMGHVNFFKTGVCLGRHLICCVKTTAMSSTVKVMEPNDVGKGKKKQTFSKMFSGAEDDIKTFKEFYVPAESYNLHFLKAKVCVGSAKGFEIISLETLERQPLLDLADTSFDFVQRRGDDKATQKPIHIERLDKPGIFLLNYQEYSFFVNRNGWRARPEWRVDWQGEPKSFAMSYPYILAFDPCFIEIRNIDQASFHSIITGKNIRMLHGSTREILYAYEDEAGVDVIASLDFWGRQQP